MIKYTISSIVKPGPVVYYDKSSIPTSPPVQVIGLIRMRFAEMWNACKRRARHTGCRKL